jgi:hypothetical protein
LRWHGRTALRNIGWAVILTGLPRASGAETTANEPWPELDAFININQVVRLVIPISIDRHDDTLARNASFGLQFDFALKPVFRRELRNQEDVFKKRFLSFRTGYRYTTTLNDHAPYTENRGIVELTARYLLPAEMVLSDRNRGDLRFIAGQNFSTRYRNKLQLERDFRIGQFVFTPYTSEEVFYDTRYDIWNRNRTSAGVEVPFSPNFVLDAYYTRQNDSRSTPPHTNVLGLKIELYY